MEVTALCIRLSINVLFLQCALHQKVDSIFLRVDANRLQFFEYETLAFHCEGLEEEVVLCRRPNRLAATASSCIIKYAFPEDSGEYWCEASGGKRSNSINIAVTAGTVILESPVFPVTEGDAVTLRCRNKSTSSSHLAADFYKDGLHISSRSTGTMAIHSVAKSDEGLYKCDISGVGGSPGSWLAVRETSPACSSTTWIIVVGLLMVLLLAVGLLHFGKGYWHGVFLCLSTRTPGSDSAQHQTVHPASVEDSEADLSYAASRRNRKKEETAAGANPPLNENALYSTIQYDTFKSCRVTVD